MVVDAGSDQIVRGDFNIKSTPVSWTVPELWA